MQDTVTMVITPLDRITKLSHLQKELLAIGLRQHYRSQFNPLLRAGFNVKHFTNANAARRSVSRLAARGLIQRVSRGYWWLTELGVQVAGQLWARNHSGEREIDSWRD